MQYQTTKQTKKVMKRKAMTESHALRNLYGYSKSDALRQGWQLARVTHAMRTRKYVIFEFLKTDGKTIRKAIGTLNPLFTPPVRGLRTPPPSTQVFFDVEKGEWRSFRKSNLLRILM